MSDIRFIYADPGLHRQAGHHPNAATSMLGELNRRGIPSLFLAFVEVDQVLRDTLGASPFFRHNLYSLTDYDPLCGPAFAFHVGAQAMREDLHALDLRPTDIVFVPWALAAQLWGIVQWLRDLPPQRQPLTVLNFLHVPEVVLEWRDNQLSIGLPDYRDEPSAMFLRFAAKHVTPSFAHRIRPGCTYLEGVAVLTAVLELPVRSLPAPQHATGSIRRRSTAGPLTIGMIGHQRGHAKGVQYMPELVREVLQLAPTARVLIQDCSNDLLPEIADILVRMSSSDKRISLLRGPLDAAQWANMLNEIDLLICPYSRADYRLSSSGVHNEAIANAIPSVVPSESTLAAMTKTFGGCGATFGPGEPASILDATRHVLANFERYAGAAYEAARHWDDLNGPRRLLDALLQEAQQPSAESKRI